MKHPIYPHLICGLLVLSGCASTIEVAAGRPATDLTEITVGVDQETVERILGDPIYKRTSADYRVNVYECSLGVEGMPEALFLWPLFVIFVPVNMAYYEWCTIDSECNTKVEQEKVDATRLVSILLDKEHRTISIAATIDLKSAAKLSDTMIKAAEGDADSQFTLSLMVAPDQGWRWLCLAAKQGFPSAQASVDALLIDFRQKMSPEEIALAERLVVGRNVASAECEETIVAFREHPEALKDARLKARNKDLVESQYQRGNQAGDMSTGWRWYCQAAHNGHSQARYVLGNYYRMGYAPVAQDSQRAFLWYSLAGDTELAPKYKDDVVEGMTAEEQIRAGRLVAEWRPNIEECGIKPARIAH